MPRPSLNRKFHFQQLEDRRLMAGNVDVSVSGGDLFITGDNAANGVQITQVVTQGRAVAGFYLISGLTQGGAATTINGQVSVNVNGVTDDVTINLRDGGDRFRTGLGTISFADDVNVNLGSGNNELSLNRVRVRDDVSINSGNGVDTVFLRGVVGTSAANPDADLSINTGEGADTVILFHFFVRDDVNIDTGFGQFDDTVLLVTGNVGDDVTIRTRDGGDDVFIDTVGVNDTLQVETGSGGDRLDIENSEADELFAFLGSGDDHLEISDTFGQGAMLDGQSGADTIALSNVSFSQFFSQNSF